MDVIVQAFSDRKFVFFLANKYFNSFFTVAFTKLITVNGQEYHLQLVDTAGQVSVRIPYSVSGVLACY